MKCTVRKWKKSDAKSLSGALSNRRVLDMLRDGLPYPYTERDGEEYIAAMLGAEPDDTFAFAIEVDGVAVGSIGAFRQGNIHRCTAELGYYLSEEYWGRGIMTEAVAKVCKIIFETSDIIRIFAEPFSQNAASCRVLEKAGFTLEGVLRCNAEKNGIIMDMNMYSLIREGF